MQKHSHRLGTHGNCYLNGSSVCDIRKLDSHTFGISTSLDSDEASTCIIQGLNWHVAHIRHLLNPKRTELPLQAAFLLEHFKSVFPSLVSLSRRSPEPKHSSPGLPPEVLQSGLLKWTCTSKSGKKIQTQTCNVSPESLEEAKTQCSGTLPGDTLERNRLCGEKQWVPLVSIFRGVRSYVEQLVAI